MLLSLIIGSIFQANPRVPELDRFCILYTVFNANFCQNLARAPLLSKDTIARLASIDNCDCYVHFESPEFDISSFVRVSTLLRDIFEIRNGDSFVKALLLYRVIDNKFVSRCYTLRNIIRILLVLLTTIQWMT